VCWSAEERGATDGPVVNTSRLAAAKSPQQRTINPNSSITALQRLREITSYECTALGLFLFFQQSQSIHCSPRLLTRAFALDFNPESHGRLLLSNEILERSNRRRYL
jgi:hypothetical protein